jgi:PAS domain S-box-containing protein
MKTSSILFKLIAIVLIVFACAAVMVLTVANRQMIGVIDQGKSQEYRERLTTMVGILQQHHQRLLLTQREEAYRQDFQEMALNALRNSYVKPEQLTVQPFIIDRNGHQILNAPTNPYHRALPIATITGGTAQEFVFATPEGNRAWCIFQHFDPWDWRIGYVVPLELKYATVDSMKKRLAATMCGAALLAALALVVFVRRQIKPILNLTAASAEIAQGNYFHPVPIDGSDEVAQLATQFEKMRVTIQETMHELTAQKEAAEQERVFMRNLIDAMPDLVFYKNRESVYLGCNRAFAERFIGRPIQDISGKTDRDFVIGTEQAEFFRHLDRETIESGKTLINDEWIQLADGSRMLVETAKTPFFTIDGSIGGLIGIARDVTLQRQTQQELKQLTKDLELRVEQRTAELRAANQELESFCYSVSHDLQAPLRHINSFTTILLEDYGTCFDATGANILTRICQASSHMSSLIDDLLRFSRVSRLEMRIDTVDLSAMAHRIVTMFRESDPDRTVAVTIESDLVTRGDASMLDMVLQNLIGNAWKYSAKNPHAEIVFGKTHQQGKEVFYIRDNGVGFDMAYQEKLFRVFERLHGEEFEGTGIGLATVQRIVERHGGKIWAESQIGTGSTFYFTL